MSHLRKNPFNASKRQRRVYSAILWFGFASCIFHSFGYSILPKDQFHHFSFIGGLAEIDRMLLAPQYQDGAYAYAEQMIVNFGYLVVSYVLFAIIILRRLAKFTPFGRNLRLEHIRMTAIIFLTLVMLSYGVLSSEFSYFFNKGLRISHGSVWFTTLLTSAVWPAVTDYILVGLNHPDESAEFIKEHFNLGK